MKKIFAIVASILLASTISFAKDDSRFGFGVKGAFDYGMMYGFEEEVDDMDKTPSGFGFEAGAIFRINLAKGLHFAPEVNFSYISTSHNVLKKERTYSAWDLEIPLMFRAELAFLNKLYITAGPQIILNLQNSSEIPPLVDGTGIISNLNTIINKLGYSESTEQGFFNFGIAAGLGYNIIGGLCIDARFYIGFMELFPETKALGVDDDIESGDAFTFINMHGAKMMKFKVGISYWFM